MQKAGFSDGGKKAEEEQAWCGTWRPAISNGSWRSGWQATGRRTALCRPHTGRPTPPWWKSSCSRRKYSFASGMESCRALPGCKGITWPGSLWRARSQGIGKQLLGRIRQGHPSITLHVYRKNRGAVAFYQREGFTVTAEAVEEGTGETEYTMVWQRDVFCNA